MTDKTCFYAANFKDYRGLPIKLCWSEKLWNEHVDKHPEIISPDHASELIAEAILRPSLVITGFGPKNKVEMIVCYYKEHKSNGNDVFYSKVVVGCRGPELYVKTIFQGWALSMYAVQEKKYHFNELHREQNTRL